MVKRFYRFEHRSTSLREVFIRTVLRRPIHVRHPEFSLTGLDLRIERGEAVALVGSNGSGKSTVLRLVAGIYAPSEGVVETHGRLAAVIELGAGFHPELTGADNVALYGALMGLSRTELAERWPEIADFAEIGDFINTPVKYYSSGMQARLAFAVAVCVEPDILLVDEALTVGDQHFREKCLERLRAFHREGGTMMVVSHDLEDVRALCTRAVWVDRGRVRLSGEVDDVLEAYLAAK